MITANATIHSNNARIVRATLKTGAGGQETEVIRYADGLDLAAAVSCLEDLARAQARRLGAGKGEAVLLNVQAGMWPRGTFPEGHTLECVGLGL